ncbi:MAG: phosphoribosylformimino-5-aminoimidazole carboxamide ribotide isomerase [Caldilineaceae bacterium]|nr:phosphoribosylformimino-5-aminoimidazole carboxamide ribotide isomerase [Caldilineaceae bacterium]
MRFRPCIDLLNGRVVQIVGGSLTDQRDQNPVVNFETEQSPADYARLYEADNLAGGHIIALGPGNQAAALGALAAFPGGMQMGGGITPDNAKAYLDAGASHVIVTSYVFRAGQVDEARLQQLVQTVGKARLVLDLSCRQRDGLYWVVTDRWQRFTEVSITADTLAWLAEHCAEFLVHAVDVEGKRLGIDATVVEMLGAWSPIPVTYAGGVKALADLDLIRTVGQGKVDATIGSALDIFGGDLPYRAVLAWHRQQG